MQPPDPASCISNYHEAMSMDRPLPPGQYEIDDFPRFGLSKFATRFGNVTGTNDILIEGTVDQPLNITNELRRLEKIKLVSDFHCVTTWTKRNLIWGGYLFTDLYQQLILPIAEPQPGAAHVVIHCTDGYRVGMQLNDLLKPNVLLADSLNSKPLSVAHGTPWRLIAPDHYGYKNAKCIKSIEFKTEPQQYRTAAFRFMDHPRARVDKEERGRYLPGWIYRYLYRPLVGPTKRQFANALADYDRRHPPRQNRTRNQ